MVSDRAFIIDIYILWDKALSLVPKSRSSVKVKYQGHSFQKNGRCRGIWVTNTFCFGSCNFARVLLIEHSLTISSPKDKILDQSKWKTFTDQKINVSQKLKFLFGRVENIVGNGENAVYQHFLFFHNVFKAFLLRIVKSQDSVLKG